jgi:hypothetical protein
VACGSGAAWAGVPAPWVEPVAGFLSASTAPEAARERKPEVLGGKEVGGIATPKKFQNGKKHKHSIGNSTDIIFQTLSFPFSRRMTDSSRKTSCEALIRHIVACVALDISKDTTWSAVNDKSAAAY